MINLVLLKKVDAKLLRKNTDKKLNPAKAPKRKAKMKENEIGKHVGYGVKAN